MQLLMHLNDEYEAIRGQILLLEPLPTVNKAYSMIQRVERQRRVTNTTGVSREVATCVNKFTDLGDLEPVNALMAKGKIKKDYRKPKMNKFCDHYQKPGHEKDQCFKLIGYPDWYDDFKGKKKPAGARLAANVANYTDGPNTPLADDLCSRGGSHKPPFDFAFIQVLAQEVAKLTKGGHSTTHDDRKDAGFVNFAGTIFTGFSSVCCLTQPGNCATWIVDTGASNHMSYDPALFDNLDVLPKPICITLPDGSVKQVTSGDNVTLDDNIVLKKVLYVTEFKFNLLSVTKVLADQKMCIHMYPTECIFQDLTTNQVMALAHENNGLFFFESTSRGSHSSLEASTSRRQNFRPIVSECFTAANKTSPRLTLEVLHARLGHTSMSKMRYISECKDVLSDIFFCETCILEKAHRLPFGRSTISTKNSFELVHKDLWGPYRVANLNGARYFVTIVDDYTSNTWTQLL